MLTSVLFILVWALHASLSPWVPVVAEATPSILVIETNNTRCTGFAVGLTRVLTSEHCAPDDADIWVQDIPARIAKRNKDFVLLEVAAPTLRPLSLAKQVSQGEAVITLGYAQGQSLMVYGRLIAGLDHGSLILDGPLTPGMSGGPVLNSAGDVVGLNQATLPDRGLACPIQEIRDFLK